MKTLLLAVAVCSAALLPAQTLTEYAVAASGGASAAVAGKGISAGLDKIFGDLNKKTAKAATEVKEPPKVVQPAKFPADPGSAASSGGGGGVYRPSAVAGAAPGEVQAIPGAAAGAVPTAVAASPATPLPESSREALQKITAGMSRKDVIAGAGPPASRIMMDEDGHLVEVFTYIKQGESLGTVRLMDGTVEAVRLR